MPAVQQRKRPPAELKGYLLECDVPTMQFIKNLEATLKKKPSDKPFIIEELDETHAWIRKSYKGLIDRKVDEWLDTNVWTSVDRLDQDFDLA